MENTIPPSYEEATTRDHWPLVADYIDSADIPTTNLVCQRWHEIFAPYLWGNPARHFGTQNDEGYVALTRFKKVLPYARSRVRQLTHTLHLPPALSELYDEPRPEWLRDVLHRLPNLQSLVVSELPFFDHSALISLRNSISSQNESQVQAYPLRLLVARGCANTTSAGLAEGLLHLPNLVLLDLSGTTSASDNNVLGALRFMQAIRVLKLRGIGLRDSDVETVASAFGLKLRSLDISSNKVTDNGVRSILAHCRHQIKDVHSQQRQADRSRSADQHWHVGVSWVDARVLDEFRGDDLEERLVRKLTGSVVGHLSSEDVPHTGITHLYLAGNSITLEGVASLLRTENLHVLDIGDIDTAKALSKQRPDRTAGPIKNRSPGAEKLTPVLESHARTNLTSLRVHHSVITTPSPFKDDLKSVFEIGGMKVTEATRPEAHEENTAREPSAPRTSNDIDAELPLYETSGDYPAPRYELSSKLVNMTIQEPQASDAESSEPAGPELRREPVSTTQVMEPENGNDSPLNATDSTSTPLQSPSPAHDGPISPPSSLHPATTSSLASIQTQRHNLRKRARGTQLQGLMPGLVPCLRTLVITDVPNHDTPQDSIVSALKIFISNCALEAHLASTQATLESPTLHIPGRSRSVYQTHRTAELFALRVLVLEMQPLHARSAQVEHNRSSTEDPDSENFWAAQEEDFSFFEDEKIGSVSGSVQGPNSMLRGKMPIVAQQEEVKAEGSSMHAGRKEMGKSVVAELARWRAEMRAVAERVGRNGFVDGFWNGEVKVVRPESGRTSVDGWYGGYFERGYSYA